MFSHCLLPALLLLAAVNYCTAYKRPPVKTLKAVGAIKYVGGIELYETFHIPEGHRYGVLKINAQSKLRCPPRTKKIKVVISVYDYKTAEISVTDHLNHVTIYRGKPLIGVPYVDVKVVCIPLFKR